MNESDLHAQTLKQLLKKFSSSELFVLPEVAQYLKVSESYVADLISSGKLKAFKADSHWFIEEKWLNDFKNQVRAKITEETTDHHLLKNKNQAWVKSVKKSPKEKINFFKNFDAWLLKLNWNERFLLTCLFLLCLSFVANPFAQLNFGYVNTHKQELAYGFLIATDQAYSWPSDLVKDLKIEQKINDEVLTIRAGEFLKKYKTEGTVAGAFEKRDLEQVKEDFWEWLKH